MPNSFDFEARSPSDSRLYVLGVCLLVIACAAGATLIAKSQGKFERLVRVHAALVNIGDGLPAKSDVKFRGILVGKVSDVVPARVGQPNLVQIDLHRELASTIPGTVTARVVPSNVFAVSSVQLVDNGQAPPLRAGATIPEDNSLATVLFQTTLNKLRQVIAAVGREQAPDAIGPLSALGQAVEGRGDRLRQAATSVSAIITKLNGVVATEPGPSTISALSDATQGLKEVAPGLFDALRDAIRPARTLAEKRIALSDFVSHGLGTVGTVRDAFEHQTDRLINISTQLTPVTGVLADRADKIYFISTNFMGLSDKLRDVIRVGQGTGLSANATVSLTPVRQYVRADCPRYGELLGPSCFTAPEVPTAPDLFPALASRGFPPSPGLTENRPNVAPPRDSVRPGATPPVAEPPAEDPMQAGIQHQSAEIGADIGPVGSAGERAQLSRIVGGEASVAHVLMLGPLARGTTVIVGEGGADGE